MNVLVYLHTFVGQTGQKSFFLDFIYLFLEKGEGRKKGEKHRCVVASHAPPTGDLAHNPRHVPWLGIKPPTFRFAGQHLIRWATSVRAGPCYSVQTTDFQNQTSQPCGRTHKISEYRNQLSSLNYTLMPWSGDKACGKFLLSLCIEVQPE